MALSIKTAEADALARQLSRLTGESMTEAVTVALRERLDRERVARREDGDLVSRIAALVDSLQPFYDTSPVTSAEWDWASGDDG